MSQYLKQIPSFAVNQFLADKQGFLIVALRAVRPTIGVSESTMGIYYYHTPTMPHEDILADHWTCIYRLSDGVMLAYSYDFFSKLQSFIRPLPL